MSFSKVEKTIIRAFRTRWLTLKKKSIEGTLRSYRRSLALWFEAINKSDCYFLARTYYGIAHIERMCELSAEQILTNLNPVCRYLDVHFENDEDCPTAKDLLSSEYVLFDFPRDDYPYNFVPCDIYLDYDDDAEEGNEDSLANGIKYIDPSLLNVRSYTSTALYDDWYERVGGFNTFFLGILMKSTGEPFSKKEARMLTESVVHNVTSHDLDELWVFEMTHQGNQMVVSIDTDYYVNYVDPIKTAIAEMGTKEILMMVKDVLDMKHSEKENVPYDLLKAINTYSKQRRPNIETFKKKLVRLMGMQKDNYKIRIFEDALRKYLFAGQPYYHYRDSRVILFITGAPFPE
jgi:hypothetical protein